MREGGERKITLWNNSVYNYIDLTQRQDSSYYIEVTQAYPTCSIPSQPGRLAKLNGPSPEML